MGKDHIWAKTIYGQRPYMGKDHIWAKTIYGIQHSGTGKSDPKDDRIQHSWQENQTQRPYMGFNTVGQENQTQKTIGFNTVGKTQRPYMGKDHIWDSTQWDRKIRPKRR